jgi:centromeric protein E
MVGEDHSVAALLKEKDAEIAELRARLDDKDRMLGALRNAARSRDNADRVDSRAEMHGSRAEARRTSKTEIPELRVESNPDLKPNVRGYQSDIRTSQLFDAPHPPPSHPPPPSPGSPTKKTAVQQVHQKKRSVDEMSKMLDEMIQDRVEAGQLIRGSRGSVRVVPGPEQKGDSAAEPPIQLQLLTRQRAALLSSEPSTPAAVEV